jgi:hypothetical protein
MRGLAEYAMSGRFQAATVAVLFGMIPGLSVVSGAVVALVTLRRGLQEGLIVALWAALPAGLQWMLGDAGSVFMLLGVLAASQLLRKTESWQSVCLLITALGVLLQASLVLQQAYITQLQEGFTAMMASGVNLQVIEEGEVVNATPEQLTAVLLRFYGASQMLVMISCMLLARYWQALLYNPGGFQQEFHQLRFDWRLMLVWLAVLLGGAAGISPLSDWLPIFCMVPILNALAVVHWVVAKRKLGTTWVILAYVLLMIAAPAFVLLGFVDSVADIRKRMSA